MRSKITLIIFLIFISAHHLFPISQSNNLVQHWENMVSVNDNEKNFRFVNFIDSLEMFVDEFRLKDISDQLPAQWGYAISQDSSVVAMAGVMPFRARPARLIYLLGNLSDGFHLYNMELENRYENPVKPDVNITKTMRQGEGFIDVSIFYNNLPLVEIPDVKVKNFFRLLVQSRNDAEKEDLSEKIWTRLSVLLADENLFEHDFSGFNRMSTLISPDKRMKICTWNIEYFNGDNAFYGGVATKDKNNDGIQKYRLIDKYRTIEDPERVQLEADNWFGAVYYDLVEQSHQDETHYTLLGYNGNDAFSKIRVVDVISFSKGGQPLFGKPVFQKGRDSFYRLVFKYSIRANMMLRYEPSHEMIIMDNLGPVDPIYRGDYRYYGPDFSHNGLSFENGYWIYSDEIDVRNPAPSRRRNR